MNRVEFIFLDVEKEASLNQKAWQELQDDLDHVIENANNNGEKVVSVTPITSSNHDYSSDSGYGYGYGYTSALVVVFEKV